MEQIVIIIHNWIKYIFLIVAILSSSHGSGQIKYFVLRDNNTRYSMKNYVLRTESLYPFSGQVELYNLFLKTCLRNFRI